MIKDELNIKNIHWAKGDGLAVKLDTAIDDQLRAEGEVRELIRQVQEMRKQAGANLDQKIKLVMPGLPVMPELLERLKRQTLASDVVEGEKLWITLL